MSSDEPDPRVLLDVFHAQYHRELVAAVPPNNVMLIAVAVPVDLVDGRPAYVQGGHFVMAPADLPTLQVIQILQSVCNWAQRQIAENERCRVVMP